MESTKGRKRKVYGKRFKLQAVKQVIDEGKPLLPSVTFRAGAITDNED